MRRSSSPWASSIGEWTNICLAIPLLIHPLPPPFSFLSILAIGRPELRLLGTTALFIASKFEETNPPEIGEFVYITDNYNRRDFLKMEVVMLNVSV